jgi:hypothetical protein
MNPLAATVFLALGFPLAAYAGDQGLPKIEPPPYLATFANNAYRDAEAFKKDLLALKSPWRELFDGPQESSGEYTIAPYDKLETVEILHSSKDVAVVKAVAERYRTSFCAVVFLLAKNGDGFRVADIIRRTDLGYSYIGKVEVLPLKPEKYLHLHLSIYRGGRRLGWTSDELFIVKDELFQPTLALRDGFSMTPANPYRSFDQNAELRSKEGAPSFRVTRRWTLEKVEKDQNFDVDFHWDAKMEKWISPDAGKIQMDEPEIWDGKKLPKPPEDQKR